MNLVEAQNMVETALEQRRKFGKHFTVSDMPPEFLDALVMEVDRLKNECRAAHDRAAGADEAKALREQLTLANRQLGAAKSRETKLRNEVAELKLAVDLAGKKGE